MAGMWFGGEDLPQESNRVTLHPTEKDQFDMAIPNVHFDDHANDVAIGSSPPPSPRPLLRRNMKSGYARC